MKRAFAFSMIAALSLFLGGCGSSQAKPATAELFAMDTVMKLSVYGDNRNAALKQAESEITRLESLLSRTDSSSEVSQLNQTASDPSRNHAVRVDGEVSNLIAAAQTYSDATGGAFDITIAPVVSAWGFTTDHYQVPSQDTLDALLPLVDSARIQVNGSEVRLGDGQSIDLGGIAKGYASDRIADIFTDNQIPSGMISLGGNVYVRGSKPDGSAWRVAVQDPNDSSGFVGILNLTDAFAVTSGGYQRYFKQNGKTYHHIIDPVTGYPAENGLISVTIVDGADPDSKSPTGNGTMCDAFSTALFVMGTDRAVHFWRSGGYSFDMVLVTSDGRVLITPGIAKIFEKNQKSGYTYEVIR